MLLALYVGDALVQPLILHGDTVDDESGALDAVPAPAHQDVAVLDPRGHHPVHWRGEADTPQLQPRPHMGGHRVGLDLKVEAPRHHHLQVEVSLPLGVTGSAPAGKIGGVEYDFLGFS